MRALADGRTERMKLQFNVSITRLGVHSNSAIRSNVNAMWTVYATRWHRLWTPNIHHQVDRPEDSAMKSLSSTIPAECCPSSYNTNRSTKTANGIELQLTESFVQTLTHVCVRGMVAFVPSLIAVWIQCLFLFLVWIRGNSPKLLSFGGRFFIHSFYSYRSPTPASSDWPQLFFVCGLSWWGIYQYSYSSFILRFFSEIIFHGT